MANLPHPQNLVAPFIAGDLFFPGGPGVTFADLPGALGSRAIEFGEDGTSISGNRPIVALSKNIEWCHAHSDAKIAKFIYEAFTPAAGNGTDYTIAGDMWVGEANSLPETQEVRNIMCMVLDADFNQMLDPSGDRVEILAISDAKPPTQSMVGDTAPVGDLDGFHTGCVLTFQTRNPDTGAVVVSPYTIPNGTLTYFVYGIAREWDDLADPAKDHQMMDALSLATVRFAGDMPAKAFSVFGERAMRGDLDLGAFGIKDLDVPVAVHFGQPILGTSLFSPSADYTSVLGALNSAIQLNQASQGNRALSYGGVFTFTGATGHIDWTQMYFELNGERILPPTSAAAGFIQATDGEESFIVVKADGTMDKREPWAGAPTPVLDTDLIVAHYLWNLGGGVFTYERDCRWVESGRSGSMDITCGGSATTDVTGCDYPGTAAGIQAAIRCMDAQASSLSGAGANHLSPRIILKGDITIASTVNLNFKSVTYIPTVTFKGDGILATKVISDGLAVGDNMFDCKGLHAIFEDIQFQWKEAKQNDNRGCIHDLGSRGRVSHCMFTKHSSNSHGFANAVIWTGGLYNNVTIEDLAVHYPTYSAILGTDNPYSPGSSYISESSFSKITIDNIAGLGADKPDYGLSVPGDGNEIDKLVVADDGILQSATVVGGGGAVRNSYLQSSEAAAVGVAVTRQTAATERPTTIEDCQLRDLNRGVLGENFNNAAINATIHITKSRFNSCAMGVKFDPTLVGVGIVRTRGCDFRACDDSVHLSTIDQAYTTDNTFAACARPITVEDVWAVVEKNNIDGNGPAGGDLAIDLKTGCTGSIIDGNVFGQNGAETGDVISIASAGVKFINNDVGQAGTPIAQSALVVTASGFKISGNEFVDGDGAFPAIYIDGSATSILKGLISGNAIDDWADGAGIKLEGAPSTRVVDNDIIGCRAAVWSLDGFEDGNSEIIKNNRITNCGSGQIVANVAATIYIAGTNDRPAKISGNEIDGGGDITSGAAVIRYAIHALGKARVEDNDILNYRTGDGGVADMCYVIRVVGKSIIDRNNIELNLTLADQAQELFCIYADASLSSICNNVLDLDISGAILEVDEFYGIYAAAVRVTIDGNKVSSVDTKVGGTACYWLYAVQNQVHAVNNSCNVGRTGAGVAPNAATWGFSLAGNGGFIWGNQHAQTNNDVHLWGGNEPSDAQGARINALREYGNKGV